MINLIENPIIDIAGENFDKEDLLGIIRLQKVLIEYENIYASHEECSNIWGRYSNDLSASWLYFPNDDINIIKNIKSSNFFTSFEDYAK